MISLTDLIIDRMIQAANATSVAFDDAVALLVATYAHVDWEVVGHWSRTVPSIRCSASFPRCRIESERLLQKRFADPAGGAGPVAGGSRRRYSVGQPVRCRLKKRGGEGVPISKEEPTDRERITAMLFTTRPTGEAEQQVIDELRWIQQ